MRPNVWRDMGLLGMLCLAAGTQICTAEKSSAAEIEPTVRLEHPQAGDQDDLCFWYDAEIPAESRVITSDKKAGLIATYDLQGALKQLLKVPKPGNIDIRQHVDFHGTKRDLVVVNQRTDGWKLAVLEMNRQTRQLERLDQGDLTTGPNYGVCLYHSRKSGTLQAAITSEEADVEQYQLDLDEARRPSIRKVRSWELGKCEGAVADDEFAKLYIAVEEEGVWELGAEPDQPTPGKLVIRLGEHGLRPDLEGITLLKREGPQGYLIVSSQGQNRFFVYERTGTHRFVGSFSVSQAEDTDGIDLLDANLGDRFPAGVFGCHTAVTEPCRVLLVPWETISSALKPTGR